MTKFFKGKKSNPKPTPPRVLEAIMAEYNQLKGQAGELQYVLATQKEHLDGINQQLRRLNQEGSARKQLDEADKAKTLEAAQAQS